MEAEDRWTRRREEARMKGITPFLWFEDQAEEAAKHYVSIFSSVGSRDAGITDVGRYGASGANAAGRPEGSVMTVAFRLDGQDFVALNGGPEFQFTEAVSLMVNCETQEEVDQLWERLSEGGEEGPCGWLKDRYGLSWQVVPTALTEMMQDEDPKRAERVMAAMLQMKKIDIESLRQAYEQRS
jgi:predicted 3-demethylubiquinone-9 3-methyltransferase (glyoxalase superfamily)